MPSTKLDSFCCLNKVFVLFLLFIGTQSLFATTSVTGSSVFTTQYSEYNSSTVLNETISISAGSSVGEVNVMWDGINYPGIAVGLVIFVAGEDDSEFTNMVIVFTDDTFTQAIASWTYVDTSNDGGYELRRLDRTEGDYTASSFHASSVTGTTTFSSTYTDTATNSTETANFVYTGDGDSIGSFTDTGDSQNVFFYNQFFAFSYIDSDGTHGLFYGLFTDDTFSHYIAFDSYKDTNGVVQVGISEGSGSGTLAVSHTPSYSYTGDSLTNSYSWYDFTSTSLEFATDDDTFQYSSRSSESFSGTILSDSRSLSGYLIGPVLISTLDASDEHLFSLFIFSDTSYTDYTGHLVGHDIPTLNGRWGEFSRGSKSSGDLTYSTGASTPTSETTTNGITPTTLSGTSVFNVTASEYNSSSAETFTMSISAGSNAGEVTLISSDFGTFNGTIVGLTCFLSGIETSGGRNAIVIGFTDDTFTNAVGMWTYFEPDNNNERGNDLVKFEKASGDLTATNIHASTITGSTTFSVDYYDLSGTGSDDTSPILSGDGDSIGTFNYNGSLSNLYFYGQFFMTASVTSDDYSLTFGMFEDNTYSKYVAFSGYKGSSQVFMETNIGTGSGTLSVSHTPMYNYSGSFLDSSYVWFEYNTTSSELYSPPIYYSSRNGETLTATIPEDPNATINAYLLGPVIATIVSDTNDTSFLITIGDDTSYSNFFGHTIGADTTSTSRWGEFSFGSRIKGDLSYSPGSGESTDTTTTNDPIVFSNSYELTDLDGNWNMHQVELNPNSQNSNYWERYTGTISSGLFTTTGISSDGESLTGSTQHAISSKGLISFENEGIQGALDVGKNIMIFSSGEESTDPKGLHINLKRANSYSLSDLDGNWNNNGIVIRNYNSDHAWRRSSGTISNGAISFGGVNSEGSAISINTTASIDSTTGIVDFNLGNIEGALDASKTVMVWTNNANNSSGEEISLAISLKQASSYSLSDLNGTWRVHILDANTDQYGTNRGTVYINQGSAYFETISNDDITNFDTFADVITVDENGIVYNFAGSQGALSADKNVMVITTEDTRETTTDHELLVLVKTSTETVNSTLRTASLQFDWFNTESSANGLGTGSMDVTVHDSILSMVLTTNQSSPSAESITYQLFGFQEGLDIEFAGFGSNNEFYNGKMTFSSTSFDSFSGTTLAFEDIGGFATSESFTIINGTVTSGDLSTSTSTSLETKGADFSLSWSEEGNSVNNGSGYVDVIIVDDKVSLFYRLMGSESKFICLTGQLIGLTAEINGFQEVDNSSSSLPAWGDITFTDSTLTSFTGDISVYATSTGGSETEYDISDVTLRRGTLTESASSSTVTVSISGTPATEVDRGTAYTFTPSASASNSGSITYSIQNQPSWASFSTSTGTLSGTPTTSGVYSNIVITASSGSSSASLDAFSIEVINTGSTVSISGTPTTYVVVGNSYSFTPTAEDTLNGTISFDTDETSLPSWLTFSSSTGSISGTPTEEADPVTISITADSENGSASLSFQLEVVGILVGKETVYVTVGGISQPVIDGGLAPFQLSLGSESSSSLSLFSDSAARDGFSNKLLGQSSGITSLTITDSSGQSLNVSATVFDASPLDVTYELTQLSSAADYKMVTFPMNLSNITGSELFSHLQSHFGTHGQNYILYSYNGTNYTKLDDSSVNVGPGYGYWMGILSSDNFQMIGTSPSSSGEVQVNLSEGWNMIGNPFASSVETSSITYFKSGQSITVESSSQTDLGHVFWGVDSSGNYQALSSIGVGQAAWLYSGIDTTLVFSASSSSSTKPRFAADDIDLENEPQPPSRPKATNFNSSSSGGGGGGGGCLLRSFGGSK